MKTTQRLKIPKKVLDRYERLMRLPSGHHDLNDFPVYDLIERWTAFFHDSPYEMDIKVCSSARLEPLWCEAVLFHDGTQVAYTEPETKLRGKWVLCDGDHEFVVCVVSC